MTPEPVEALVAEAEWIMAHNKDEFSDMERKLARALTELAERVKAAERRDCEKATDLVNAGLHAQALRAQRDELVEALEEMLRCFDRTGEEVGGYSLRACLDARAALAKVEGKEK